MTFTPARGLAEASYTVPYSTAFCEAAKAVAAHSRSTEQRNAYRKILLISPPKDLRQTAVLRIRKKTRRKAHALSSTNEDCVGPVSLKNCCFSLAWGEWRKRSCRTPALPSAVC